MLPPLLSDNWCSLLQGADRYAFALDVTLEKDQIKKCELTPVLIRVERNYVYEETALLARPDYNELWRILRVNDSHEVVEKCMILMNYECSKRLKTRGIFRSATKKTKIPNLAPDQTELREILHGAVGTYCSVAEPHEVLGLPSYTHITSPIRRIVDCINMLELQPFIKADAFVDKWLAQLTVINQKMKSIRKLQNDLTLLTCQRKNEKQNYRGVVWKVHLKVHLNKYKIYIPAIKLLTSFWSEKEYTEYSVVDCAFYLFLDEERMEKKVRVQIK
jgi:exoribonuclease R